MRKRQLKFGIGKHRIIQNKEKSPTFTSIMIGFELAITAQERVLEVRGSKEI